MIYLIGGAPCSGKTTLANALSSKLSIPMLGTDIIRTWMQKMLKSEEYPELFHAINLSADEYLINNSSQQIVEREVAQQKVVSKGILAFIESNYEWDSYVLEGTGITPGLITNTQGVNKDISAMVLVDKNTERIRSTIFKRGLWGEPQTYSDNLKEIEVQWVVNFNTWYDEESWRLHIPHLTIGNRDTLIQEAFTLLRVK